MSLRLMQGRSQGTTLRASDLNNARETILNPFNYNAEQYFAYQMTKWISRELWVPQESMHWGLPKMADILLTTFSNAFSWVRMFEL